MKNEEQFFKGIEDTLHTHEDAYVPGAWEEFQQKRNRRGMGMWFVRVGSAAAVLLLVAYVAFLFVDKTSDKVEYAGNKPAVQQPKVNQAPTVVPQQPLQQPESNVTSSSSVKENQLQQPQIAVTGNPQPKKQPNTVINTFTPANTNIAIAKQDPASTQKQPVTGPVIVKPDSTVIAVNTLPEKNNSNNVAVQNPVIKNDASLTVPEKVIANNNVNKPKATTRSLYDSLLSSKNGSQLATNTKAIEKDKERKVNYDVVMQPAVGNQKFNIGGGVQVSYKLSERLSVNSGIAYASLNATAATSGAGARSAGAQNVNLAVSGVEVPVGIKYHADNGYYVSAGVMGMSVINNHMEYSYVSQGGSVQAAVADKESLAYSAVKSTPENVTEQSKEKVANYLGFYILSAGKKIDIGKKKNINIGPFLRVPFGPVSSEKVRLMQGGVTLGFGF